MYIKNVLKITGFYLYIYSNICQVFLHSHVYFFSIFNQFLYHCKFYLSLKIIIIFVCKKFNHILCNRQAPKKLPYPSRHDLMSLSWWSSFQSKGHIAWWSQNRRRNWVGSHRWSERCPGIGHWTRIWWVHQDLYLF